MAERTTLNVDVLFNTQDGRKFATAIGAALAKESKKWTDDVRSDMGQAVAAATQYAFASGQSGRAMKKFVKDNLTAPYLEFRKAINREDAQAAHRHHQELQKRLRQFKRELASMSDAYMRVQERQERTLPQRAAGLRQGLQGLRGLTAEGGLGGLEGVGGRIKERGLARQFEARGLAARANELGDTKGAAAAAKMAKFGEALATVGKAVAGFAAIAAVIVTVVKLIADLESKIKDMNKALLDSAGAADFGFSAADIRGGALRRTLEELRNETTSLNENFRKFRAGAAEQQRILAAFNQAGLTYAKMNEQIKQGSKFMKNYSDVTAVALTYSRNLGVSSDEIAQRMGAFAFETGQSLEQVAEQFSIIQREAMVAGFVTKRFYSAIVEVTSGMNFYGVRIEETTKLLKSFDSLLGEAAGTEVFKKIAREGGKSFQDTLQEFLIKEPDFVARQYKKVYDQRLAALERQLTGVLPQGTTVQGLIQQTGGGAALAQRLEEMGITGQRGTDIMQVAELMKAATGDLTAMIGARGAAGPAFEAAMKLRAMPGLQAGQSLGEVYENAVREGNTGLLVALQQLAQSQGQDFDELKVLDQKNLGRLQALQKIAKEGGEVPKHLKELGFFIQRLPDGTAKVMRGIVDENGMINEKSAVEITDRFDMLLSQPTEDAEVLKEQLTKDQQIAAEISRNITGLNNMMEQTVAAILNDIYDVLLQIADFMFRDEPRRLAQLHFQKEMAAEAEEAAKKLKALTDEQDELNAKQERGEKLTKEEIARVEALPEKIGDALEQTEIAQNAAEIAKNKSGQQIMDAYEETYRQTRAEAGDRKAQTKAAEATATAMDTLSQSVFETGPGGGLGKWEGMGADLAKTLTLGSGATTQALSDRLTHELGLTGVQARGRAKVGRALGLEGYEGLSDEDIRRIGEAAEQGAESYYDERGVLRDVLGVGTVTGTAARGQEQQRAFSDAMRDANREAEDTLEDVADKLEQGFKDLGHSIEASSIFSLFGKPQGAGDALILPEGGPPIMTDPADTIMAGKPGGPVAAAMGGGGRSPVSINIYGGDTKKIYDVVMRVLKETGNA